MEHNNLRSNLLPAHNYMSKSAFSSLVGIFLFAWICDCERMLRT